MAKIQAEHTGGGEARKATSDTAKGLEAELLLANGSRVMLTANIWTEAGLVNALWEQSKTFYLRSRDHLHFQQQC